MHMLTFFSIIVFFNINFSFCFRLHNRKSIKQLGSEIRISESSVISHSAVYCNDSSKCLKLQDDF
jgi:hypothetical protein